MGYVYVMRNLTNNKKFVGRTIFNPELTKYFIFYLLDNDKHYNELLQKDYKKDNFKISFFKEDQCFKKVNKMIENDNLLNPLIGYNVFADIKSLRGLQADNEMFNEDVCLLFCWGLSISIISSIYGVQYNTVANRLSNYNLHKDGYYKRNISTYDDFCWTTFREAYQRKETMSAARIISWMSTKYDISNLLMISSRKLSSFLVSVNCYRERDDKQNCLVFSPWRVQNEGESSG